MRFCCKVFFTFDFEFKPTMMEIHRRILKDVINLAISEEVNQGNSKNACEIIWLIQHHRSHSSSELSRLIEDYKDYYDLEFHPVVTNAASYEWEFEEDDDSWLCTPKTIGDIFHNTGWCFKIDKEEFDLDRAYMELNRDVAPESGESYWKKDQLTNNNGDLFPELDPYMIATIQKNIIENGPHWLKF